MAQSMRQVTSSALEVLTSSDTLMKAVSTLEKEENGHQEQSPPIQKSATSNGEVLKEAKSKTLLITKHVQEEDTDQEEELHLCYADFELLFQNGAISKEQLKSGKVKRRDGQRILKTLQDLKKIAMEEDLEKSQNLSLETSPTSIDCGLKRVPSKRYKRDYIVNRSPKPQKKMWNVNTGSPKAADVVKSSPAGEREQAILNDTEESVSIIIFYL